MIARHACFAGDLIQIDRLLIPLVNEGARATEPFVNFAAGFGFGIRHCGADFTARVAASERILANLCVLAPLREPSARDKRFTPRRKDAKSRKLYSKR